MYMTATPDRPDARYGQRSVCLRRRPQQEVDELPASRASSSIINRCPTSGTRGIDRRAGSTTTTIPLWSLFASNRRRSRGRRELTVSVIGHHCRWRVPVARDSRRPSADPKDHRRSTARFLSTKRPPNGMGFGAVRRCTYSVPGCSGSVVSATAHVEVRRKQETFGTRSSGANRPPIALGGKRRSANAWSEWTQESTLVSKTATIAADRRQASARVVFPSDRRDRHRVTVL